MFVLALGMDLLTPLDSVRGEFIVADKLPQSTSRFVFASCAHALMSAEFPRLIPLKFPGRRLLKFRNGRLGQAARINKCQKHSGHF